jgi:hypothetical protein
MAVLSLYCHLIQQPRWVLKETRRLGYPQAEVLALGNTWAVLDGDGFADCGRIVRSVLFRKE